MGSRTERLPQPSNLQRLMFYWEKNNSSVTAWGTDEKIPLLFGMGEEERTGGGLADILEEHHFGESVVEGKYIN